MIGDGWAQFSNDFPAVAGVPNWISEQIANLTQ